MNVIDYLTTMLYTSLIRAGLSHPFKPLVYIAECSDKPACTSTKAPTVPERSRRTHCDAFSYLPEHFLGAKKRPDDPKGTLAGLLNIDVGMLPDQVIVKAVPRPKFSDTSSSEATPLFTIPRYDLLWVDGDNLHRDTHPARIAVTGHTAFFPAQYLRTKHPNLVTVRGRKLVPIDPTLDIVCHKVKHAAFYWINNGRFSRDHGPILVSVHNFTSVIAGGHQIDMSIGDVQTTWLTASGATIGSDRIRKAITNSGIKGVNLLGIEEIFSDPVERMLFSADLA